MTRRDFKIREAGKKKRRERKNNRKNKLRKIIKVAREVRGKKKEEIHIFLLIYYKMFMMYVITQFWVIPQKSPHFQNKNKKIK
jgi:tryptophan synthase alpha subunit